jgi:hypothetical protein
LLISIILFKLHQESNNQIAMKITRLSVLAVLAEIQGSRTQNTFPTSGSVEIGTTSPETILEVREVIRATTGMQIRKSGVPSNSVLSVAIDKPAFASTFFVSGWGNSGNLGIIKGTTRNDSVAFNVVTDITFNANYRPAAVRKARR